MIVKWVDKHCNNHDSVRNLFEPKIRTFKYLSQRLEEWNVPRSCIMKEENIWAQTGIGLGVAWMVPLPVLDPPTKTT